MGEAARFQLVDDDPARVVNLNHTSESVQLVLLGTGWRLITEDRYQHTKTLLASVQSSSPTRDLLEKVVEIAVARASKEAVMRANSKSRAWDWQTVRREALETAVAEFGASS